MVELYPGQLDALDKMHNGCILCGGVGSGKSITSVAYYYINNGGSKQFLKKGPYLKMKNPKKLYIITTARKRDTYEWEKELQMFMLSQWDDVCIYDWTVVVDSWNNIGKYENVKDAFFIFDEQRVVGYGKWAKTFIKIAKENEWILLSATPGDTWSDYIPVFIANGFYKNKTEFEREHIVWARFTNFPMIDRYIGLQRLERLRDRILVDMPVRRSTVRHHHVCNCSYDKELYRKSMKHRWDPFKDEPCVNASAMCQVLRKIVNTDVSRQRAVVDIFNRSTLKKVIIFYNYDYELEILRGLDFGPDVQKAEWNGHAHNPIPDKSIPDNRLDVKWVYFVQYTAGCEGWNCTLTDTIVFFSQNYSFKVMEQACGRIDRINTKFIDLHYYHLKTESPIDRAIDRAVKVKKKFNEAAFLKGVK